MFSWFSGNIPTGKYSQPCFFAPPHHNTRGIFSCGMRHDGINGFLAHISS
jgi:hypothetical protein